MAIATLKGERKQMSQRVDRGFRPRGICRFQPNTERLNRSSARNSAQPLENILGTANGLRRVPGVHSIESTGFTPWTPSNSRLQGTALDSISRFGMQMAGGGASGSRPLPIHLSTRSQSNIWCRGGMFLCVRRPCNILLAVLEMSGFPCKVRNLYPQIYVEESKFSRRKSIFCHFKKNVYT